MKWLFLLTPVFFLSCSDIEKNFKSTSTDTLQTIQEETARATEQVNINTDPALVDKDGYLTYTADAKDIRMYWKHKDTIIQTFQELKRIEPGLRFAMNGGMYTQDYAPVGLYIEHGKQLKPVKRYNNPKVNFGLQPQGIFLTMKNGKGEVVAVEEFRPAGVQYATQSAPMVVLKSKINPKLPHSESRNIRNGVGMLPNGQVLLVLSRNVVTFQEFAQFFVDKGCTSALYLDGGISDAYVPQYESYGYFGVLIGVVNKK